MGGASITRGEGGYVGRGAQTDHLAEMVVECNQLSGWFALSVAELRGRADLAEDVELFEGLAGADDDRAERVFGEEDRQARLFAQERVEVLQERAAAGEDDAAIGDVAGQLGRRALQRDLDRLDDGVDRLGERVADLV